MRLNIKINFKETYPVEWLSRDLNNCKFVSETDQGFVTLFISIEKNKNPILPEVYNLAFGPLNSLGQISDQIKIKHKNNQKVYSTIIYCAFLFLKKNKSLLVGLDGSNIVRSVLYFRILLSNYDYLTRYFQLTGIKYYIRLIRNFSKTHQFDVDTQDIINIGSIIYKNDSIERKKLYNYFILKSTFE